MAQVVNSAKVRGIIRNEITSLFDTTLELTTPLKGEVVVKSLSGAQASALLTAIANGSTITVTFDIP